MSAQTEAPAKLADLPAAESGEQPWPAERAFWETAREIPHIEAREAARRLVNSHFRNPDSARVSIPANPDQDDDLVLHAYIRQQARKAGSSESLAKLAEIPAAGSEEPRLTEAEWRDRESLRQHWVAFCDADIVPEDFIDRMEAAGFARLRKVTRDDLQSTFADERGIERGGHVWVLTEAGSAALATGGACHG